MRHSAMWVAIIIFMSGMYPLDSPWMIAIGLIGFIGACFIPKDV